MWQTLAFGIGLILFISNRLAGGYLNFYNPFAPGQFWTAQPPKAHSATSPSPSPKPETNSDCRKPTTDLDRILQQQGIGCWTPPN